MTATLDRHLPGRRLAPQAWLPVFGLPFLCEIERVSGADQRVELWVATILRPPAGPRMLVFTVEREHWLPRLLGQRAVCLGDRVLLAPGVEATDSLLLHEAVHVVQFFERAGGSLLRFLRGYRAAGRRARRRGAQHPWELEAAVASQGMEPQESREPREVAP